MENENQLRIQFAGVVFFTSVVAGQNDQQRQIQRSRRVSLKIERARLSR